MNKMIDKFLGNYFFFIMYLVLVPLMILFDKWITGGSGGIGAQFIIIIASAMSPLLLLIGNKSLTENKIMKKVNWVACAIMLFSIYPSMHYMRNQPQHYDKFDKEYVMNDAGAQIVINYNYNYSEDSLKTATCVLSKNTVKGSIILDDTELCYSYKIDYFGDTMFKRLVVKINSEYYTPKYLR